MRKSAAVMAGLVLLVISVSTATAKTYYVDQNLGAAKAAAGQAILRSIQAAAEVVEAGDSVLVGPGVYPELVSINRSGLPGKKITFKAGPGKQAIVQGTIVINGDYVRLEGFHIDGAGANGTGRAKAAASQTVAGVLAAGAQADVIGQTITNVQGTGISAANGDRVANNYIYHCQYGIFAGSNCIVENNEIERLYQYDTNGDCDYIRFIGNDIIIRDNYLHGTIIAEVGSAHLDCFQTFDNNNTPSRNVWIERNFCTDSMQGAMLEGIFYHQSSHIYFYNNVFYNLTLFGIGSTDVPYTIVVNNTFYNCGFWGVGVSGAFSTNNVCKNNIFCTLSDRSIRLDDGAVMDIDYNLYYQTGPIFYSGPHDIINQDPLFADATNQDFRLQVTSPAVDAGGDFGVSVDADSNARPQRAFVDIGAFEYTDPSPVSFYASPTSGPPPLAVTFTNTSSGSYTSWQWDFGDGNTGTRESPTHTYHQEGTFTVRLIGTNAGGSDTSTAGFTITVRIADIIIEAEQMTLTNGYKIDSTSMNGQGIVVEQTLPVPSTGTATATFAGATGTYTMTFIGVPENDGQPPVKLYIGGVLALDVVYPMEGSYLNPLVDRTEFVVNNLQITEGAQIRLEGTSDYAETPDKAAFARVDKIVFTPVTGVFDLRFRNADLPTASHFTIPNPVRVEQLRYYLHKDRGFIIINATGRITNTAFLKNNGVYLIKNRGCETYQKVIILN